MTQTRAIAFSILPATVLLHLGGGQCNSCSDCVSVGTLLSCACGAACVEQCGNNCLNENGDELATKTTVTCSGPVKAKTFQCQVKNDNDVSVQVKFLPGLKCGGRPTSGFTQWVRVGSSETRAQPILLDRDCPDGSAFTADQVEVRFAIGL